MDAGGSSSKASTRSAKINSKGGTTIILNEKSKKKLKLKKLVVVVNKIDTNNMSNFDLKDNNKNKGKKNKNKSTKQEKMPKIRKKSKLKKTLDSNDTVSESTAKDSSTKFLNTKRKRYSNRVLERGKVRTRKGRPPGNKRLVKLKPIVNTRSLMNYESTSNSENSEHGNIFNEINWEENLEIDASDDLVEEFAPRPSLISKSKLIKAADPLEETIEIKKEPNDEEGERNEKKETPAEGQSQPLDPANPLQIPFMNESIEQEFTPGLQIYVKDYKTNEWNKASILEVDWDEEEVLVHYEIENTNEWVSMSSQRLSSPATKQDDNKDHFKEEMKLSDTKIKTEGLTIKEEPPEMPSEAEPALKRRRTSRNTAKFRRFRSNRKGWRFKRQSSIDSNKKFDGKFEVGEKVLAKWSNHRMQKFPAIIKSISGKGTYDLVFYDGFEKTINEDNIYKTTEEEAAKYQDSKPSEADSFVDMDADSKEARRQRKRKTFDDYVFAKDFKKKKRNKVVVVVDSVTKKPVLQSLHTHCRKGRRRRKLRSDEKEEIEVEPDTSLNDTSTNDNENSNMAATDSDNYHELLGESEDRWTGEIPPDAKPLNIECSDGIRKSVIVPDKVLPHGWTKQCINRTGQMWETFLISPEGYRLNTKQDLKEYSRQILGSRTPKNLDFVVHTNILSDLIVKQENLQPVNNWLPWLGKSSKKKSVAAANMTPLAPQSQFRIGRIRTLLPKTRTQQNVTISEPPAATFSEIWRCPKQGCDKKFRKENLLQMHIKHYHVEFTALVGNAPNVVELACARSESVNAEPNKTPIQLPPKKLLTKLPPQTPPHSGSDSSKPLEIESTSTPLIVTSPQNTSPVIKQEPEPVAPPIKSEERKSTIKTMLPLRQPTPQEVVSTPKLPVQNPFVEDSDDLDSDEGVFETKPFKHGRGRKKSEKKLIPGMRSDDISYPMSPTNKFSKKKLSLLDKLHVTTDSNDSYTEEEKASPNTEATTDEGGVVIERLKSEEIINCNCGYREEDGLMIQCDICMCWQHGMCSGVENDADVPDRYICYICRHPAKVRSSKKYSYALHYLSQGKLPSFSFRIKNERDTEQREMVLKRCYELSASLRQIQNVEKSLKAKINIAEQAGHPKLYLWAKSWDESNHQVNSDVKEDVDKEHVEGENGNLDRSDIKSEPDKLSGVPEPEAPIDLEECRMRLLDHIDNYYQQLDDRLMSLQTQIAALESQDPDLSSNVVSDKTMKQTIQMLLKDLKTVQKIASVS